MTFGDFWPTYYTKKELSVKRSSLGTYELMWETRLREYWEGIEIESVRNSTMQNFVDGVLREGRVCVKTVRDYVLLIKNIIKMYNLSEDKPAVSFVVVFPTSAKSGGGGRVDKFSDKELSKLVDFLKEEGSHLSHCILLEINTGMRIGELCCLKFCDFDFENQTVHIQRTLQRIYLPNAKGTELIETAPKTISSDRIVPIPKWLVSYFKQYKKLFNKKDDDYIVGTEPRTLRIQTYNLIDKAGVPRKRFHCFRHTYASRLLMSKVDIRTTAELLGHADVQTTLNVYAHSDDNQKKAAAKKIFL